MSGDSDGKSAGWEQELLKRFAFEALREQRAARRWNVFFKLALLGYLVTILVVGLIEAKRTHFSAGSRVTALVDVRGAIGPDLPASADNIVEGLRAAFEDARTAAVVLRINSPGGSPVQSAYVNDEIRRLRGLHPGIKLYAVVEDICASGAYYIAAAADEIYADKGSLVGSIGVRMDGFGFVEAMQKLGVERRLLTAGEHKGMLDPFLPQDAQEVGHVKSLLEEIHQQFIATVKKGRGERLKGGNELFSGLIWTGEKARELGLVDALGSASFVAREVVGAEELVDFTAQETVWERVGKRFGTSLGTSLRDSLTSLR